MISGNTNVLLLDDNLCLGTTTISFLLIGLRLYGITLRSNC